MRRVALPCLLLTACGPGSIGSPIESADPTSTVEARIGAGTILLRSTLDSAASISAPASGPGGTTNLGAPDFVGARTGKGARFSSGKVVSWPAVSGGVQAIELDRGEVDLWYRPSYDAASSDDRAHTIFSIGSVLSPPNFALVDTDRLAVYATQANGRVVSTAAGRRQALWTANQWVHLQVAWDESKTASPIEIWVNGVRVDSGGSNGPFDLGTEAAIGSVYLGAGAGSGLQTADGVIDDFVIRSTASAPADAGVAPVDTGVRLDATAPADTGVRLDATAPADTGVRLDATAPADSGVRLDATAPADSGVALDATAPADSGVVTTAGALLQTSLESAAAITAPAVGPAGTTNLGVADFVTAQLGRGASFTSGKVASFPATDGVRQAIELDRGEIELWYRPSYAANASDDSAHGIMVVGDVYNAPRVVLQESDALELSFVSASWSTTRVSAPWHANLWSANQWVKIRATWDRSLASDALKIYVNDVRVDTGGAAGGFNLGTEAAIGRVFIGGLNQAGDGSAAGIIDEVVIRGASTGGGTPSPDAGFATPDAGFATPDAGFATPDSGPRDTGVTDSGVLPPPPSAYTDPSVVISQSSMARPAYNTAVRDPAFGTTLRRITNKTATGGFGTQIYSQLQAFSANNQYVLLVEDEVYVVRRASDLSLVSGLDTSSWNAPRWHPVLPGVMLSYDSNGDTVLRVQQTDMSSLQTTTIYTFPSQYQRIRPNQSFDEVSRDGRWMGGMAQRSDGVDVLFAVDLQNRALGAQLPLSSLYGSACAPDPTYGQLEPDWAGVSPRGRYLMVQWKRDGTSRCSGLESFDIQSGGFLGRVHDGHQHGDMGIMPDGVTEFFMTFEIYHPSGQLAIGTRNLPGTASTAPVTYVRTMGWYGEHISCRGPNGVCLVTASDGSGWGALQAEVFLQYTNGSVERLAHHRSTACGYWVQPRATFSTDGRYVVFASDWGLRAGTNGCGGSSLGEGEAYLIDRAIPR